MNKRPLNERVTKTFGQDIERRQPELHELKLPLVFFPC
jgi:hypothetical protein